MGAGCDPAGNRHFLLVAAGQPLNLGLGPRVDLQALDRVVDGRVLAEPPDRSPGARARAEGERDVLPHRALHEKGLGTVAGHVDEARADGVGRMPELDRLSVHLDGSGRRAIAIPRGPRTVRPDPAPRARRRRGLRRHGDRTRHPPAWFRHADCERGSAGHRRSIRPIALRIVACGTTARLLDCRAEHQFDDPFLRAGAHGDDADCLAVAKHGGAIAKRRDLEKPVRDEDHRPARPALATDDVENPLGEIRRQRRRHLVEEEHVRLDRKRPREIEHAQDRRAECCARFRRDRGRGTPSSSTQSRNGFTGVCGEAEIGGDIEIGNQRRLLVDRYQSGAAGLGRRMHVAPFPADEDRARVRPDRAGQDLHQRRFPGAVSPHQCVDLARPHRQRGVPQRRDGAVVLRDAGGFEEQLVCH